MSFSGVNIINKYVSTRTQERKIRNGYDKDKILRGKGVTIIKVRRKMRATKEKPEQTKGNYEQTKVKREQTKSKCEVKCEQTTRNTCIR